MFKNTEKRVRNTNKLIEAIHENDVAFVKEFFNDENNIPYANAEFNGIPIIIYAAQEKKWDIFKVLYNSDANLDAQIEYAKRYLIYECIDSAPENLTMAVMEYCNLNVQNRQNDTPIMYSYKKNKSYVVDYLIDKVDLSRKNNDGDTFAHLVAKNKDYDTFLKLMQFNAPIQIENKEGLSALDCIEDASFKEQLSKMLSELNKANKVNDVKKQVEEVVVEEKPKLSGISSIKKKKPN